MKQMTVKTYKRSETNRTKWKLTNTTREEVTDDYHKNATNKETLRWFRNLGGKETTESGYTKKGYEVVKHTSISPDGEKKIVRTYKNL